MFTRFPPEENSFVVFYSLERFLLGGSLRVESYTIDVFDIRGAAPARHHGIRECAAVFIAEHQAILSVWFSPSTNRSYHICTGTSEKCPSVSARA